MRFVLLVSFAFFSILSRAWGAGLVTDLSQHQVSIRSTFTGTDILLFGAIEMENPGDLLKDNDIVVVVSSPLQETVVRKKKNIAGLWLNYEAARFSKVPGFYAVASTRALDLVTGADTRMVEQIGADQLTLGHAQGIYMDGSARHARPDELKAFSEALIRSKKRSGLYYEEPQGVIQLGHMLFRSSIVLPANVPIGLYTVKVYLFQNGDLVDAISSPLFIDKSGLERTVFRFAHREPFLYGLFAVVIAVFAGWTAALVFRD